MSSATFPTRVVLALLGEEGFQWVGDIPLARFPRLLAEDETAQAAAPKNGMHLQQAACGVFVNCRILRQPKMSAQESHDIYILNIDAAANINLVCQRCLQQVSFALSVNVQIALLANEQDEGLLEDDADYLILDDILAYEPQVGLDVVALIEDELLLMLPISPRHDDCHLAVQSVGELVEEEAESDNPFAVLADLKGKL